MKRLPKLFMLTISFLLGICQISCTSDDDPNSGCGNIGCTEIFVTIIVSIEDQNQNPLALDSFEVINIENESEVTISLSPSELMEAQQSGQYPLVSDGGVEINQELQLQFKGFINNQEVINSNYTVSADCCHVSLVSGDLQLVL